MITSNKLSHARAAFDSWRKERTGKPKIPDKLWLMAVALLDDYAISHVARELRLNQTQLRTQHLALTQSPSEHTTEQPSFLQVNHCLPTANDASALDSFTLQLLIERVDGHRLTLALSSSHAGIVHDLVTAFIRS